MPLIQEPSKKHGVCKWCGKEIVWSYSSATWYHPSRNAWSWNRRCEDNKHVATPKPKRRSDATDA